MAKDRMMNEVVDRLPEPVKDAADKVVAKVAEVAPEVKETADRMVAKVAEATPDSVKETADKVAEKVAEVTPDSVKQAADKVADEARRHPGIAIAAGLAALLVVRRLFRRKR
ncbi:hypothetical protein [Acrocarpospora catenulata]|uniref:hypothetical protein n=1 Tax=Acrocarpospora catenulata TaxID=2836182 RepID=UPI001BDA58D7|nr:hypothetical protein [Acrocarpospora catenulata]